MSELVMHIGFPKTGTTALQRFFRSNHQLMRKHGWSYPQFTKQKGRERTNRNGIFLCMYCFALAQNKAATDINDLEKNMQSLNEELSFNDHVLLSDEAFSIAPTRIDGSVERAEELYWKAVSCATDSFPTEQVKIILYIRKQEEMLSSSWKQRSKNGLQKENVLDWSLKTKQREVIRYGRTIELIEQAFHGECEIVVRLYDRNSFEGGSIYNDFCHAAGIPWDQEYFIPKKDSNPSLSFDVAEALRPFYNDAPFGSTLRESILISLAKSLSKEFPDPPGITPFSAKETEDLLRFYHEDNRKVAERFFGREDLFPPDERERVIWQPNEARIKQFRKLFKKECRRYQLREKAKNFCRIIHPQKP